jgi:hypothetical protein
LPAGPWPSPYWREIDAAIDVLRARLMGADAFAIDIVQIGSGGIWNQARTVCATAAALVPDFHIVLEIDSYVVGEASVDDMSERQRSLQPVLRSTVYRTDRFCTYRLRPTPILRSFGAR